MGIAAKLSSMRIGKKVAPLCALVSLTLLGLAACSKDKGATFDLEVVQSKAKMGMSEFDLVNATGAPTRVDVEGKYRHLRYDSKDGKGYLIISLKENRVVDVSRRD